MVLIIILVELLLVIAIIYWRYKTAQREWEKELVLLSSEKNDNDDEEISQLVEIEDKQWRSELFKIFNREDKKLANVEEPETEEPFENEVIHTNSVIEEDNELVEEDWVAEEEPTKDLMTSKIIRQLKAKKKRTKVTGQDNFAKNLQHQWQKLAAAFTELKNNHQLKIDKTKVEVEDEIVAEEQVNTFYENDYLPPEADEVMDNIDTTEDVKPQHEFLHEITQLESNIKELEAKRKSSDFVANNDVPFTQTAKDISQLEVVELNLSGLETIQLEDSEGTEELVHLEEVKVNWAPIERIAIDENSHGQSELEEVKLNLEPLKPILIENENVEKNEEIETIVLDIKPNVVKTQQELEVIEIPDYFKNRALNRLKSEEIITLPEKVARQVLPKDDLEKIIEDEDIRKNLMRQRLSRRRQATDDEAIPVTNSDLTTIQDDEVFANLAKTDSPINRVKSVSRQSRPVIRESIIPSAARVDNSHGVKLEAAAPTVTVPPSSTLFTRFTPFKHAVETSEPQTVEPLINEEIQQFDAVNILDSLKQQPLDEEAFTESIENIVEFDSFQEAELMQDFVYEPQNWQDIEVTNHDEEEVNLKRTFPDNVFYAEEHLTQTELSQPDDPRPMISSFKTNKEWENEFSKLIENQQVLNTPQPIVEVHSTPETAASSLLQSFLTDKVNPEPKVSIAPVVNTVASTQNTSSDWILPNLDLLYHPDSSVDNRPSEDVLIENGIVIEEKLSEFKVKVNVVDAYAGPVISRYEIEPDVGVRGSQVVNLEKDLARALGFASIRVVETIPGKTCMGLELPNPKRQMIRIKEILADDVFTQPKSKLTLALGQDISGQPVVTDLAKAPHLLVAGTTGSGKSVGVNAMILSMLYKASPEEVRLIMIDPKMLELSIYEGIPHLLTPVVTDMKLAANALNWCVNEMEKRYRLMSHVGVRNLAGYNQKVADAKAKGTPLGNPFSLTPETPEPLEKLPFIVVVVDEFADLMMTAGKKIEELIARLAQKARAAGIHLILATQRPSVDVITGLIKANIPTRIAFQVSSKIDSRTILDQMGAENLLGQGDMLFLPPGTGYPLRVHGAFVADEEVHQIVEFLKQQGEPQYIDDIVAPSLDDEKDQEKGSSRGAGAEDDPLYDEAVELVIRTQKASISSVQRQLRIGYNRAARLVEQMEQSGIVSSPENNGNRTVLVVNNQE